MGTGIELCYDLSGAPEDPVIVLIAGLGRQLIGWDDSFCEALVAQGFRVLRFDNRDVGLSTHLDGGPPFDLAAARHGGRDAVAYTLEDMADDTVALLDELGVADAHMVGTSMGGMIGQTLAITHPSRVRSLCSIMSTTGADDVGRPTPEATAAAVDRPPRTETSTSPSSSATTRSSGRAGPLSTRRGGERGSNGSTTVASTPPARPARSWPWWRRGAAPTRWVRCAPPLS